MLHKLMYMYLSTAVVHVYVFSFSGCVGLGSILDISSSWRKDSHRNSYWFRGWCYSRHSSGKWTHSNCLPTPSVPLMSPLLPPSFCPSPMSFWQQGSKYLPTEKWVSAIMDGLTPPVNKALLLAYCRARPVKQGCLGVVVSMSDFRSEGRWFKVQSLP